jgi:DNA replication protein DnaC
MGTTQVHNLMATLKLDGMRHGLEQTLQEATHEGWSLTELLDNLLQAEYDWRERRRTERLLKNSRLKIKPALEDFDFTAKRTISRSQIKELYNLGWLSRGRPLLMIGPTGVGKTFLAQALGHHACRRRHSVLFMSISHLLENQMLARASGTYLKFRDKLIKPDLLILDDFGLRKFSSQEAYDLCDLLEERQGVKSTVITTQLPLDHWSEVIEDPVIADSIIDRLIHTSLILTLQGESYRKIQARQMNDRKK